MRTDSVLGIRAGLAALALLAAFCFPSRLTQAFLRGHASIGERATTALAGTLLDIGAVAPYAAAVTAVFLIIALAITRGRGASQRLSPLLAMLPAAFGLGVLAIIAQEMKHERGSYPTLFDLRGGSNASFLRGALGFIGYNRVYIPIIVALVLGSLLVWRSLRRPIARRPTHWCLGVAVGLALGVVVITYASALLQVSANRFSAAALGDPLTPIVESAVDVMRGRSPATARDLVRNAHLSPKDHERGPALVGWPPAAKSCTPHPYSQPLDASERRPDSSKRGAALLRALSEASRELLANSSEPINVFFLSLEGYRADDIHALNPHAPAELHPFTNAFYTSPPPGVLTSKSLYQAGVRTIQAMGAMLCGVGTLPYNLSFIRDLQPFPMRCLPDLYGDAGFRLSFLYGSDPGFDEMNTFLAERKFEVVGGDDFPKDAPRGTWDGVTDFAVFDTALEKAEQHQQRSQFIFVMSLSNHSPFTAPGDLPPEIADRAKKAFDSLPSPGEPDDLLRLQTHSYTDAALERFFTALRKSPLGRRAIVVMLADHSTGHNYLWDSGDPSDKARARIPFIISISPALLAAAPRAHEPLARAQKLLDSGPWSQNDVPAMVLALTSSAHGVQQLPKAARWHTLGGQVTSPYFTPPPKASIIGINGVSELFILDDQGRRVGNYQDSMFIRARADRYRVTPLLIPITSALIDIMVCAESQSGSKKLDPNSKKP